MKEKFLLCYKEVFNEDGTIKPCGRKKCIQLIEAAEELFPEEPAEKFGSTSTGIMNVIELKKLKSLIELS